MNEFVGPPPSSSRCVFNWNSKFPFFLLTEIMKDWRRVNENTHPNLLLIHVWCLPDHKKLLSTYTSVSYATNTLRMMFVTYATKGRWYLVFAAVNGQDVECVWFKACRCWIHVRDLSHGWTVCRILITVNNQRRWPMRERLFLPPTNRIHVENSINCSYSFHIFIHLNLLILSSSIVFVVFSF
jgi:hypothetical protein